METNFDFDMDDFASEAFGPFNKRRPLEKTLNKKEKYLRRRCKSVDACNEVLAQIKDEAAKFNSEIKAMQVIATKLQSGQLDKAAAKKELTPHVKMLKKVSDLIAYGQVVQNTQAISEDDVAYLRDYIKGLNSIVSKIKVELKNSTGKNASESFMDDFDDLFNDDSFNF